MKINYSQEFIKCVDNIQSQSRYTVFEDFCYMSAISIYNAFIRDQKLEDQYLQIAGKYDQSQVELFPQMLALTINALDDHPHDFLGETYQAMEISNKSSGQFFTPTHISLMMAELTMGKTIDTAIEDKGFLEITDPACGAGSTLIGAYVAMQNRRLNPQTQLHAIGTDIDKKVALMCYIQLSLLHMPAIIYVGDTIRVEMREEWKTPAHILGFWDWKLSIEKPGQAEFNFEDAA